MSIAKIRIQKSDLPKIARCFVYKACVYRDAAGVCHDPPTNKGNSDAACHRKSNKKLLDMLEEIK